MRNFTSFLNRRNIKDLKEWCSANGIKNIDELRKYCNAHFLKLTDEEYSYLFEAPAAKVEKQTATEETWHVPAAERPIKQPSARKKTTRRTPSKKAKKE